MNPARRVEALRQRLAKEECDALVCGASANVIYTTGFDRVFDDEPSSVCVITRAAARVYVDSRYAEAASGAAARACVIDVVGPERDVWERVLGDVNDAGMSRVALEASLPHSRFEKVVKGVSAEVVPAEEWVEQVRIAKEDEEIERIARAAALTDAAFDHVLGFVGEGVTEAEIAMDLELYMRRHGSEGVAFDSIVASGPNSSRPHAKVSERELERGDLLTLDFGARVGGYCADMTRTIAIGSISAELRAIYETVLAANETGIAAVRAGKTGAEIDSAARAVIAGAGFGERFGHNLGHGVGIEVHEQPSVGPKGTDAIAAGAVITIEPGVYVPGVGGARIEDLVVVGENGARVLSRSPKDLIIV